jgi:hypothetical protein
MSSRIRLGVDESIRAVRSVVAWRNTAPYKFISVIRNE